MFSNLQTSLNVTDFAGQHSLAFSPEQARELLEPLSAYEFRFTKTMWGYDEYSALMTKHEIVNMYKASLWANAEPTLKDVGIAAVSGNSLHLHQGVIIRLAEKLEDNDKALSKSPKLNASQVAAIEALLAFVKATYDEATPFAAVLTLA